MLGAGDHWEHRKQRKQWKQVFLFGATLILLKSVGSEQEKQNIALILFENIFFSEKMYPKKYISAVEMLEDLLEHVMKAWESWFGHIFLKSEEYQGPVEISAPQMNIALSQTLILALTRLFI